MQLDRILKLERESYNGDKNISSAPPDGAGNIYQYQGEVITHVANRTVWSIPGFSASLEEISDGFLRFQSVLSTRISIIEVNCLAAHDGVLENIASCREPVRPRVLVANTKVHIIAFDDGWIPHDSLSFGQPYIAPDRVQHTTACEWCGKSSRSK